MKTGEIIYSLLPLIIVNGIFILLCIVFAFMYPRRQKTPDAMEKMHSSFVGLFLREFWYWIVNPFVKLFILVRVTPNMITTLSVAVGLLSGYFYYKGDFALAGWIFIINGSLDMLDGSLARATNRITRAGAFLDSSTDRYTEGAIFLGIALYFRNNFLMLMASMLSLIGSQIVSYAKARGEAVGVTTKRGLMQRAERIVLLVIVSVFYPFLELILAPYGIHRDIPMMVVILLMAVLTNYTAIVRIVVIFLELRKSESV